MRICTLVRRFIPSAMAAAAVLCTSYNTTKADDVANFYRGKSLTLMVGANPGGGYDLAARVLARHLGDHLPGRPSVVVQNMQGAGSLRLINWLYSVAPRDGSVIGTFQSSAVMEPLLGRGNAKFDTRKFTWIGNIEEIVSICIARATSGISRLDDLFKVERVFGGSGFASNISQQTATLKGLFGARIKIVEGYTGTSGIHLALQRGELDGLCGISSSTPIVKQTDEVASGRVKIFLQMGPEKLASLPDVPHIYEYTKSDRDRAVVDLVFGRSRLGRPIAGPPGVPSDRAEAMRIGLMKAMKTPALLADMAAANLDVSAMSGQEVAQQIERFYSYPSDVIERARGVMFDK